MLPRWFLCIFGTLACLPVRKFKKFEKITKNHDFLLEKIMDFHEKIDLQTSISRLILEPWLQDFQGTSDMVWSWLHVIFGEMFFLKAEKNMKNLKKVLKMTSFNCSKNHDFAHFQKFLPKNWEFFFLWNFSSEDS